MRPTKPDGTPWNPIDSNAMLQHFHRRTRDELNARDVARGLPKSLSCGRWVVRNGTSTFQVDPVLSRIKHSGAESIALRGEKWTAFCAEHAEETGFLTTFSVLRSRLNLVVLGQGTAGAGKTLMPLAFQDVEVQGKLYEKGGVRYLDITSAKAVEKDDGDDDPDEGDGE